MSRAAGANGHLSAAERAAVAAYLARLTAAVTDLADRLDVLRADLHTPACPSGQSSGTSPDRRAWPGLADRGHRSGGRPWQ